MAQVAEAGNRVQTQRTSAPARNTATAAKPPQNPSNGSNAPRDTFTPSQSNGNNSGDELWSTAKAKFGGWDKDGDGFVTNKEVETALKRQNLSTNEKAALETFRGRQSQLEESHNDEWGDENNGTSLKDIDAFRTAGDGEAKRLQEQFRIEQGLALEPKSVKDRALANKDNPADLKDKIGTRDYYIERYKDFRRRNPGEKAPDYYLNYGLKYFDRFHANKDHLQPVSQGWVDRTGVALQQKMEGRNSGAGFAALERNEDQFKKFAYDSHPSAYLDSGLQHVPYGDRIKIGMTPDSSDLFTWSGVKQGVHTGGVVVAQDIRNGAVWAGNGIADGAKAVGQGISDGAGWVGRQLGF